MPRLCVLHGQISGTVDWVTSDGREVGIFLKQGMVSGQVRCVLVGSEVERKVSNGLIAKGREFVAGGEINARVRRGADGNLVSELVCIARAFEMDEARSMRSASYGHTMFKGVVMHWGAETKQLKSFINSTTPGAAPKLTLTTSLTKWLKTMTPEQGLALLAKIGVGREFAASGTVQPGYYLDKAGALVPTLTLYAGDVQLL